MMVLFKYRHFMPLFKKKLPEFYEKLLVVSKFFVVEHLHGYNWNQILIFSL